MNKLSFHLKLKKLRYLTCVLVACSSSALNSLTFSVSASCHDNEAHNKANDFPDPQIINLFKSEALLLLTLSVCRSIVVSVCTQLVFLPSTLVLSPPLPHPFLCLFSPFLHSTPPLGPITLPSSFLTLPLPCSFLSLSATPEL